MKVRSSLYFTNLLSLCFIDLAEMKMQWFSLSHDYNVKVPSDYLGGGPSSYVTIQVRLVSTGLMELKVIALVISFPIPVLIPIPMSRFTNDL